MEGQTISDLLDAVYSLTSAGKAITIKLFAPDGHTMLEPESVFNPCELSSINPKIANACPR